MASPVPELHTPRLLLAIPGARAARAEAQFYVENREHLAPWDPPITTGHLDEATQAEALDAQLARAIAGEQFRFCIFSAGSDLTAPILGHVTLSNIIRGVFQACTLGYGLARSAQGQGYMTEACRAVIDFAFGELRLHRIMANYIPHNQRSAAVLERLGFRVEGLAKDYLFLAGRWQDHVLTALTNPNAPQPGAH